MKSKKIILLALVLALTTMASMTGCTGNGGDGKGEAASSKTVITVWPAYPITSSYKELLIDNPESKTGKFTKALMDKMDEKYPDIIVKFEDRGWAEAQKEALLMAVAGGSAPDVIATEVYAKEFIDKNLFSELNLDGMESEIYKATLDIITKDGKIFGAPIGMGLYSLQINTKLVKAAGLDPTKIPQTWDELLANAKTVVEKTGKGGFLGCNLPGIASAFRASVFMQQVGGGIMKDGKINLNTPENLKALTFIRELAKTSPKGSLSITNESAYVNQIASDKVAYQIEGPWTLTDYPEHIITAKIPTPEAGKSGNILVGTTYYSVMKSSKNIEAATNFIKVLLDDEIQKSAFVANTRISTKSSIINGTYMQTNTPKIASYIDELKAGNVLSGLPTFTNNSSKIWEKWSTLMNDILGSTKDLNGLLSTVQSDISKLQ
jgi:ABC-type glycerol-3-phosphate transport system substrate-binding protein